ncbi:hypothetical protein M758_9G179500 [Ceratodon purpureus]|nr:hypothetical protein M758_9G179500 [Ceratodon purpureus]
MSGPCELRDSQIGWLFESQTHLSTDREQICERQTTRRCSHPRQPHNRRLCPKTMLELVERHPEFRNEDAKWLSSHRPGASFNMWDCGLQR